MFSGSLHFTIRIATISPQKWKNCTAFSFLNLEWSLIYCKSKINTQKSLGIGRCKWGKKEGNHTLYLNWHLMQISSFYWKEKCCRDFYPEDPIMSTFSHKVLKTQMHWNISVWKVMKIDAKFAIISTGVLALFCSHAEKLLFKEEAHCQEMRYMTVILATAESCCQPQLVHFRRWWHCAGHHQCWGKRRSCPQCVIILRCFLMWVRRIQISGVRWGSPRRSILSSQCNEVRAVHMSVY